jgi:hypothetical protein
VRSVGRLESLTVLDAVLDIVPLPWVREDDRQASPTKGRGNVRSAMTTLRKLTLRQAQGEGS